MPPTVGLSAPSCRLMLEVQFWRNLVSKRAHITYRQVTLSATDHVILDYFQFIAREKPINVFSHLVDSQVHAFRGRNDVGAAVKNLGAQCEEGQISSKRVFYLL